MGDPAAEVEKAYQVLEGYLGPSVRRKSLAAAILMLIAERGSAPVSDLTEERLKRTIRAARGVQ